MKNRIKEAELIYNRIVITSQDLKKSKDRNEDTRDREKIFNESLTEELSRISNLANEVIPLISIEIDSDVEIYFKGERLNKAHREYNDAFYELQNFLVVKLPEHKDTFINKLSELEGFSFNPMKAAEKKFMKAISNTKTLRIKRR